MIGTDEPQTAPKDLLTGPDIDEMTAEQLQDPELLAALAGLLVSGASEGQELHRALEAQARALRCLTDWRKALDRVQRQVDAEQRAQARQAHQAEDGERHWEQSDTDRPLFPVDDPDESVVIIREIGKLVAKDRRAFSFGGMSVVIRSAQSAFATETVRADDGTPLRDADGKPVCQPVLTARAEPLRPVAAHNEAARVARFDRYSASANDRVPCDLPRSWPGRMAESWGDLLPPLAGIATHPLWHDGELLTGSGYYEATALWLQTGDLPGTTETFASPQDAVAYLRDEWLGDFPFRDKRDLAAALMVVASLLMAKTELSDAMGPPLFVLSAPAAGTGKSQLAVCLAAAVTGRAPPSLAYPSDEEERQKLVSSAVMGGAPTLFFDNLQSGSVLGRKDVVITKLVTDVVFSGRVLGVSKTFSGPAGLVVLCTGNNVLVLGDLERRTIEIRLEAPEGENLACRTFRHPDILKWTLANRGRILAAYAAILQAGGEGVVTAGGFPEWSRKVAAPVLSAMGLDGFFERWITAAADDAQGTSTPEMGPLVQAIAAIRPEGVVQSIEGEWLTAAEILKALKDANKLPLLRAALFAGQSATPRTLSILLKRNSGTTHETDAGSFRLQATEENLGARTNRQTRPVFRVRRLRGETPDMPLTQEERQAANRAKIKARISGRDKGGGDAS